MSTKVAIREKKRQSQQSLVVVDHNAKKPNQKSSVNQSNQMNLSHLLDNIHHQNMENSGEDSQTLFKQRIDKLNLKFYLETEKYLNNKQDMEKCQDQLFIILFKQISLYIEEVERLKKLLKEKSEKEKSAKERIEELNLLEKEKIDNQQLIFTYRAKVNLLERKLSEKTQAEEKMLKEIESLTRQLTFYKDKIKVDIYNNQKVITVNKKIGGPTGLHGKSLNTKSNNNNPTLQLKPCPSPMLNHDNEETNTSMIINQNSSNNMNENGNDSALKKRMINKKRSVSDNNPTPSGNKNINTLNPTASSLLVKKRYENKEGMEVNNINITLNMHVKNSNNTNINLNTGEIFDGNKLMIEKREVTKSTNPSKKPLNAYKKTNSIGGEAKSPIRTKSNLTAQVVKKGTNISNHNTAFTHLSGVVANSASKSKSQKLTIDQGASTLTGITQTHTKSSPSQVDESKVVVSFSNNTSFDFNTIQDVLESTCKNYNEELSELEELEKLLKQAKSYCNNCCEEINFPFSDGEEFSRVERKISSFDNSPCSSLVNSPVTNSNSMYKNIILSNSVAIDLKNKKPDCSANGNSAGASRVDSVNNKLKASVVASASKDYKIKVNKKRSESNKSDNTNLKPKLKK